MSPGNLTHWIENAEAREFCRDAVFLGAGVEEKQHLHVGTIIATVAEWWHHNLPRLHYDPGTRH